MKLAKVILDIQSDKFSKPYTYAIVDENSLQNLKDYQKKLITKLEFSDTESFDVELGCMVIVPFGNTLRSAFVIEIFEEGDNNFVVNKSSIRPIVCAVTEAFFTKDNIDFARFISDKYLASLATTLRLFIPVGAIAKIKHVGEGWIVSAHQYRKTSKAFIDQYVSKALIDNRDYTKFHLTDAQNFAFQRINESLKNNEHKVFVMDGITGSGKTEVYLRCIAKVLKSGKTACVLVPEISLTPQTVSRFRQRFGDNIAVLHSKMTPAQRYNQLCDIKSGKTKLVIGARSALFSPLKNIGLIVIDEEHENSYKQDKTPRYLTRDCAEWLAKQQNAVLILGSATPSIESLSYANTKDNWELLKLNQRTNNKPLPKIDVVDMGREFKGGYKNLFSQKLARAICRELKAGRKVVLFHNRRGFANYMFCRECGYTPKCPNCSTTLTYHSRLAIEDIVNGQATKSYKQMLACHHCGHLEHVPVKCPECGSPYIAKYGAGTQSVEDQLEAILAENGLQDTRIVRMDADTTKSKFGHQERLEEFAKAGPAVLLGTQMIAKGLDFDDVTLVGVVLIDTNLTLPDFRSSERTFDLILQVAGRAGRADLAGQVIVQTYTPEDACISCAARYSRSEFLQTELVKRKLLHYPPYVSLANIVISSFDEDDCLSYAKNVADILTEYTNKQNINNIEISDPTACVLARLRGKYRYHILVKGIENISLSSILSRALESLKKKSSINVTVDIDPISLL